MSDQQTLNDARRKALDQFEFSSSCSRWLFWIGAICEVGLGITFIILLDFSQHSDLVLFFAIATMYCPIVLFIFSLSFRLDRNTEMIIRALSIRDEEGSNDDRTE